MQAFTRTVRNALPFSLLAWPLWLLASAQSPQPPATQEASPAPASEWVQFRAETRTSPTFRSPDGKATMALLLVADPPATYLGRGTFLPGAELPPHRHDASEELIYVLSGRGTMTLGGYRLPVEPGTAFRISAGIEHGFKVDGDQPVEVVQVYNPAGPEQRFKGWEAIPVPLPPPPKRGTR
jgi:quercetin dioxygenase-like cupin family protein